MCFILHVDLEAHGPCFSGSVKASFIVLLHENKNFGTAESSFNEEIGVVKLYFHLLQSGNGRHLTADEQRKREWARYRLQHWHLRYPKMVNDDSFYWIFCYAEPTYVLAHWPVPVMAMETQPSSCRPG